jgi:hypothetical protein
MRFLPASQRHIKTTPQASFLEEFQGLLFIRNAKGPDTRPLWAAGESQSVNSVAMNQ